MNHRTVARFLPIHRIQPGYLLATLLTCMALASCSSTPGKAPMPSSLRVQPRTLPAPGFAVTPGAISTPVAHSDQPPSITATVWSADPIVPVLAYHQFQEHGLSGPTHVRIDDFNAELLGLYNAGYVMVPLRDWLSGDLRVPAGKRPIIFTMDDLFYHNQIRFNPDGTIDPTTGLGASYAFSQAHPDFGFHWALFMNLGDHPYAAPNQQDLLVQAITWCLEHDAPLYNHTFTHALLSKTSPGGIVWELSANDHVLNQTLTQSGHSNLLSTLGNIFALPFGRWPLNPDSISAIKGYKNPEGLLMQAIMDIDFIVRPRYLYPPYSPQFNRWDIMRMVATEDAVNYFVQHASQVPAAQACSLGPLDQPQGSDPAYVARQIDHAVQTGACPPGIYATGRFVFRATNSPAQLIYTVSPNP